MLSLLHLSDLHFGEQLDSPCHDILCTKNGATKLADIFYEQYMECNESVPMPSAIVITGDLTSTAESGEFDYAEKFINKLLDKFSIDKTSLLIVPGNHDVSWSSDNLDRPEKYSAFGHFYKRLFGNEWHYLSPQFIELELSSGEDKGVIFGFNSCNVEDRYWRGLGHIHEDQFKIFDDFFKQTEANYSIRIAALHHHVFSVHNYYPSFKKFQLRSDLDDEKTHPPISSLLNASQLLKKCRKNQIQCILHGHSHTPYSVTHTNYIDLDSNDQKHVPRSIAVIGGGSPTSNRIDEYKRNHYQYINFIKSSKQSFYVNLWSYRSSDLQPNVTEMVLSHPITLPGGKDELIISNESLGFLRKNLNKIVVNGYSHPLNDTSEDISFLSNNLYDEILKATVMWLEDFYGSNFGSAVITRYLRDLKIYKHIAIYRYDEDVRHFAYNLRENSITTECGTNCKSVIVKSRNEYNMASRERDQIYRKTVGGEDQTCLAVPLNSAGEKKNAYAVLHFAKGKLKKNVEFTKHDLRIVQKIAYILEDAIRQAEIVDVAEKRRQLLLLFNKLRDFRKVEIPHNYDEIKSFFKIIADEIFNHLGLHIKHNDAIGIFLPLFSDSTQAECLAHNGFDKNADKMKYTLGEKEGLTGAVIDLRRSDYCINHLALNKSVVLKSVTTERCAQGLETIYDHHLSWAGVPLGKGDSLYNRGALVINIATPIGSESDDYMWKNYVEPLEVIAELIDPIIEGMWKNFQMVAHKSSGR